MTGCLILTAGLLLWYGMNTQHTPAPVTASIRDANSAITVTGSSAVRVQPEGWRFGVIPGDRPILECIRTSTTTMSSVPSQSVGTTIVGNDPTSRTSGSTRPSVAICWTSTTSGFRPSLHCPSAELNPTRGNTMWKCEAAWPKGPPSLFCFEHRRHQVGALRVSTPTLTPPD